MGTLPTGTVTFLFTDIEGSTNLAQKYPQSMPALLAKHDEILNQAVATNQGFVFKTVGDGYCVAFHNANDALHAALAAQRQLQAEAWSPAPIKVRMGIHTGPATLGKKAGGSSYSGYITLALAQRVMSAGHGGQILLSQNAYALAGNDLSADVFWKDMGEHHLKDLLRPEHLYQLAAQDLQSEFPALKTSQISRHNLPTNLTSFIGREREILQTKERLQTARLLTLTGPGGTGKTRLSLKLANEVLLDYPDGVWMVELAPLADGALMEQTVASIFGLRESQGRPLIDLVTDYLRAKHLLLIFDNCEHLIDVSARLVDRLLQACPHLTILASSREALGVPGEAIYRVPSLNMPAQNKVEPEALLAYEAVRLFVERAWTANPGFELTKKNAPSVAQICLRLDGIPLALELAAARVRVLTVEQIAGRLDDRFRLLTGGSRTALPRQQTLRALIDWSYDLLSQPEKILFRRLAVFVGGWTLEAAEAICAGQEFDSYEVLELLTQLVDKSLVLAEEQEGQVRYHRLETIRQYAREKLLESEESSEIRQRHLGYFVELVKWGDQNYYLAQIGDVEKSLLADGENIRAALSWGLENEPEQAMKIFSWVVVFGLWISRGQITETRTWCETALARLESIAPENEAAAQTLKSLKARAWDFLAVALMNLGDHHASQNAAHTAVTLAREADASHILARALASEGIGALYSGDPEFALRVTEESIYLCKQKGYKRTLAWALNTMIHIYTVKGDQERKQHFENEYKWLLQIAGVPTDPAEVELELSEQAFQRGDRPRALEHVETALLLLAERGDKYRLTVNQSAVAHQLRKENLLADALDFYRRSIVLWQDFGHRAAVAHQLECFGFIALVRGQLSMAARLLASAETLRQSIDSVRTPPEQEEFEDAKANLLAQMDEYEFATAWEAGRALDMEQAIGIAVEENHE